ncbi:hypothetical protein BT63DRAFT_35964 [Microthyrium microscopicum]|uniref:Uncharacterized protein n=1 Tax=Microthyrium microscopicum TaxID=703497 RepID=A0A6A6USR0_9PEZI|nr:hypothetical protein BT63DRAFT_35964 [Microthyrium microscopicum]
MGSQSVVTQANSSLRKLSPFPQPTSTKPLTQVQHLHTNLRRPAPSWYSRRPSIQLLHRPQHRHVERSNSTSQQSKHPTSTLTKQRKHAHSPARGQPSQRGELTANSNFPNGPRIPRIASV